MSAETDYMVLTDSTSAKLANQVAFWLKQGWKPLGGIAMAPHLLFAQAMTKGL